jgi:hypothetical protein
MFYIFKFVVPSIEILFYIIVVVSMMIIIIVIVVVMIIIHYCCCCCYYYYYYYYYSRKLGQTCLSDSSNVGQNIVYKQSINKL